MSSSRIRSRKQVTRVVAGIGMRMLKCLNYSVYQFRWVSTIERTVGFYCSYLIYRYDFNITIYRIRTTYTIHIFITKTISYKKTVLY